MSDTVAEKSYAWLTVSFFNKAGAAEAPDAVTYRVDDVATGQQIRTDTALTPASVIEITLTDTDNTLLDATRAREGRRVTVKATYAPAGKLNAEYVYDVLNLSEVT